MAMDVQQSSGADSKSGRKEGACPDRRLVREETGAATPGFRWVLLLLPFAYLWFRLINNLRIEWDTNPQYSYGWVVPILILGLLWRQWLAARAGDGRWRVEDEGWKAKGSGRWLVSLLFALLAFIYLPTRLVEAATPEWRPIQWALGVVAIGLTLSAIYMAKGKSWLVRLAFPLCFFFVAIPWPTLIEHPVIQGLTRINAALVVEVMAIAGVPAVQHGSILEVGTGMVGIDEACSGIRSFQSALMISLFLGELYALSRWRRMLFVPIGFVLAMIFNVCRTSLLTYVAAQKGVGAIRQYHDPAGLTILVACTLGLWGVGWLLRRNGECGMRDAECDEGKTEDGEQRSDVRSQRAGGGNQRSVIQAFSLGLLLWLLGVEGGVQLWYWHRESRLVPGPGWSLSFPKNNPTFKTTPIEEKTRYLLRYDEGKQGQWVDADGSLWQGFYFSWSPGRVAGYLAKRHTPEICLTAVGCELRSGPELMMVSIKGVDLPIRRYVFGSAKGSLQVFHCRWEAGVGKEAYVQHESGRFNLVRGIWAGRGKQGQKILEFIVSGCEDPEKAQIALVRQLESMIELEIQKAAGQERNSKG